MASDVSYLFFKREFDDDDNGTRLYTPHAPVIKNARVVGQTQRFRAGSVPPQRASSVLRTTSSVVSGGGGGGARHGSVQRFPGGSYGASSSASRRASISVPTGASLHAIRGAGGNIASVDSNGSIVYKPWFSAATDPRYDRPSSTSFRRRASVSSLMIPAPSTSTGHIRTRAPSASGHQHHHHEVHHHHSGLGHINVEDLEPIKPKPITTFDDDLQKASLSALRTRTNQARDQLSRHRVLLDRYLPITHGPADNDVAFEVEYKFGELVSRMPHLSERNLSHKTKVEVDNGPFMLVTPYRPAEIKKKPYELPGPAPKSSFTPKMSETRKRARAVLCKVHNDPRYFNY